MLEAWSTQRLEADSEDIESTGVSHVESQWLGWDIALCYSNTMPCIVLQFKVLPIRRAVSWFAMVPMPRLMFRSANGHTLNKVFQSDIQVDPKQCLLGILDSLLVQEFTREAISGAMFQAHKLMLLIGYRIYPPMVAEWILHVSRICAFLMSVTFGTIWIYLLYFMVWLTPDPCDVYVL